MIATTLIKINTRHDYSRARKFNEANTQDSAVMTVMSVAMSQMSRGQHSDIPFAWHLGFWYTVVYIHGYRR